MSGFCMVTFLNWTAIFESCMVRCGSKKRHQKDTCLKEIGLCAQNFGNHSWLDS